jgi:hypothetical protein
VSLTKQYLSAFTIPVAQGHGVLTCCCSISYWPTSSEVRLLSSATSLYPLSLFGLPPSSTSSNREYPPLLGDACRGSFGWLSSFEESPWIAFNDSKSSDACVGPPVLFVEYAPVPPLSRSQETVSVPSPRAQQYSIDPRPARQRAR